MAGFSFVAVFVISMETTYFYLGLHLTKEVSEQKPITIEIQHLLRNKIWIKYESKFPSLSESGRGSGGRNSGVFG